MTKKQMIALFKAMEDNARTIAKDAEASGHNDLYRLERGQASAFATVIGALENPKHAKALAAIYEIDC